MTDIHTKTQRSKNMSAIRATGNKTTEVAFVDVLRALRLTGWRRHCKTMVGKPDFVFKKERIAIFVDGCFWHGCKRCNRIPATNATFWNMKIQKNRIRDAQVNKLLKMKGWKILRIWEHRIKRDRNKVAGRLSKVIKPLSPSSATKIVLSHAKTVHEVSP